MDFVVIDEIPGGEIDITGGYPPPEQHGPLRWYDTEMRCASRGCGSSTFCKVKGVQYCMKHALGQLNELVIQLEERG